MLKWVVTRGPLTANLSAAPSDRSVCTCNKENSDHFASDKANNNIDTLKSSCNCNDLQERRKSSATASKASPAARKRTLPLPETSHPSPNNISVTSFRHFLVTSHSSPLKKPHLELARTPGCCKTPVSTRPIRPRLTSRHRQRFSTTKRLSDLNIREPSELASPSYRQADDPANDLPSESPLTSQGIDDTYTNSPMWSELRHIVLTSNEHYNEREVKSPEVAPATGPLVRRKAVRRRKQKKADPVHIETDGSNSPATRTDYYDSFVFRELAL